LGQKAEVFLACGARVIIVEPNSLCLPTLKFHFAKNPRAVIVPQALGSAEGMIDLYVHGTDATASVNENWDRAVFGPGRTTTVLTVPVTTLDALINRFGAPHFVKIDVEGFEVEVLRGLSRPIPLLSFEYHTSDIDRLRCCLIETTKFGKIVVRASDVNCNWITAKTDNIEECLNDIKALKSRTPGLYGDMFVWPKM
jgi:FkbM family methyltransferase